VCDGLLRLSQVLLPVVSMMTFGDAQKQENRNRCKFFPADKLSMYG
jgi:hypothetical protein